MPFPTTRPTNLVFHGKQPFSYGHYGVHLGQEDRLTFLGRSSQHIVARFLDCRADSLSSRRLEVWEFTPDSSVTLVIPPGVAHSFDGLEGVYTLNDYRIFLPDPEQWIDGRSEWKLESDIINVQIDTDPMDAPLFEPNTHPASDLLYEVVSARQKQSLGNGSVGTHAFTEDVTLDSGEVVTLRLREQNSTRADADAAPFDSPIPGVRWSRNGCIETGPESGIVPLPDARPMYVVDHGESDYSHDAYGIHRGQEDHLTFLGESERTIRLDLVDCREGSPMRHTRLRYELSPSPLWTLVIPNGVAHRFEGLGNVFTLNKPRIRTSQGDRYVPANDVIDWPMDRDTFPSLEVSDEEVPKQFYKRQADSQRRLAASDAPTASTPIVLTTQDAAGKEVRVALRAP